ncbi:prostaglandin E receptor 1b (subtype EP1) isoform X1 [Danio rerio]|uniref:Thromboxane A2 receptor n=1 Tax=Danio rerio TaxID=7955 RepID=D0EXE2_DANRE|nr:prostaglandin E receptor 1b (subtype EP1) [Danio rerio]XP_005163802.1 prostaglandin E receptor 1b (subtype EP1) isoform X1 [Danio rerio]ACX47463.1 prostaglandin E receptor 1 subtype EP1a precursor-like protein [Danio rerio]|eukprot:NP_001159805.1 prostaglandin E receptor 1b (subtype EP1) [Danio rerio]
MLSIQQYNSTVLAEDEALVNQSHHYVAPLRCRENLTTTSPTAAGLSMTLGIVSNIIALAILANAYSRRSKTTKATFLLFASSLVVTDLVGHVIPGALVLHLYLSGTGPCLPAVPDGTCQFLGGSMVFFGLCPLFLGCAMAVERCIGVTRPLLHKRLVCTTQTKIVMVMVWLLALSVAFLPFFRLGSYTYQYPWTWCFINVLDETNVTDVIFVVLFSGLGLASLAVALVCNTISGVTLVAARLRKKQKQESIRQSKKDKQESVRLSRKDKQNKSSKTHDIEMVVQLVGIMVTSCICWSPLLIFGLMSVIRSSISSMGDDLEMSYRTLLVMGVRLASWNQILDPWVYILLRRAILRKIYYLTTGRTGRKGSTFRRWEASSFQNSVKKAINQT